MILPTSLSKHAPGCLFTPPFSRLPRGRARHTMGATALFTSQQSKESKRSSTKAKVQVHV